MSMANGLEDDAVWQAGERQRRFRHSILDDRVLVANLKDPSTHEADHLVVMNDEERQALSKAAHFFGFQWWPAAMLSFILLAATTFASIWSAFHAH